MFSIFDHSLLRLALLSLFLVILFGLCEHFLGDGGAKRRKEVEADIEMRCPPEVAKDTIFVLLPNLNESKCAEVIFDLFEKALCPKRVFIGLVENVDNTIESALFQYELLAAQRHRPKFTNNIRRASDTTRNAMGYMHAYEAGRRLYSDEMYSMVIHAHTEVVRLWDELCIQELKKCKKGGRGAIITYCPNQYQSSMPVPLSIVTLHGIDVEEAKVSFASLPLMKIPDKPVPANFWTSKFAFGYGAMMKVAVPSSTLRCVSDVQDLVISIKLWAKGFLFFTPTTEIVFHRPPAVSRSFVFDERDPEQYEHKTKLMQQGIVFFKSFLKSSTEALSFAQQFEIDFFNPTNVSRSMKLGITPFDDVDDITMKERVVLLRSE